MRIPGDTISVCLLSYNHVHLIESTLQTILDQGIKGFEIIVSDDCSTDGTWERILRIAKSDPRIRPIQTPKNMGMAGNANYAVSQTSRPYIALLHHDDLYRRDLLEKWVGIAERHAEIGFVFNQYSVFGTDFVHDHRLPGERLDGRWFLEHRIFPAWGCPVRGTALISREAFLKVRGMREEFGLLADVDLWMRLARHYSVGYVAEPVITVRQERPDYYPDIYTGKGWSWQRQRFLYEIHGRNREEYYRGLRRVYEMLKYRVRVTVDTIKWLCYAVVRNKPDMLKYSGEGACHYELPVMAVVRQIAKLLSAGGGAKYRGTT